MNADGVTGLDCHHVFAELNGTCVALSYESKCGTGHDAEMGKHREFWLHSLKYPSRLQSVRTVIGDRLHLAAGLAGARKQFVQWANQQGSCFDLPTS